jgi:hypothetical protein
MRIWNLLASILVACLLAIGFLGSAPVADAASAWQAFLKPGESARNDVIEIKHRRRGRRGKPLYLPIVPYSAYDYPYYYRRGHFPTHIGPGYVYYGYPHFYSMKYNDRCSFRHRRCVARKRGACICR